MVGARRVLLPDEAHRPSRRRRMGLRHDRPGWHRLPEPPPLCPLRPCGRDRLHAPLGRERAEARRCLRPLRGSRGADKGHAVDDLRHRRGVRDREGLRRGRARAPDARQACRPYRRGLSGCGRWAEDLTSAPEPIPRPPMKDEAPQPTRLADYAPFPFTVTGVDLTFRLAPSATRVLARIGFAPNPARPGRHGLRLDGEKLALLSARIDGRAVAPAQDAAGLTVAAADLPAGPFTWEAEVEIDPAVNTAFEGLYMSGGIYCTQCEAEGFRKFDSNPDRPDVMAPYRVRIESDMPVLLSNGNPTGAGPGWAEWTDPWPKPAYLFALVAGDL